MRRGVTILLAVLWGLALPGCPDWSRPDPALRRPGPGDGGGGGVADEAPARAPAPRLPATSPSDVGAPAGLDELRAGVARLRETLGEADALRRLERLESLGFDLLERGRADEQAEAEALLQELSDLRLEVVDRPGGG
ncbi:MAG: hypothetical protein M9894_19135 [Planctomycetes bacterium]|nr:hypothetical protein [Planctomycetota bacterium]